MFNTKSIGEIIFQCWHSPEACKQRLFKYLVPVILLSVGVNIPKFFESSVDQQLQFPNGTVASPNFTDVNASLKMVSVISPTKLRSDPYYVIYYSNWTRLITMGLIPTVLLIYFNYKVRLSP